MDLSVVIPVKNEAGNIAPLVAEIAAALDGIAAYEIVYVDDGSDDSTAAEIRRLQAALPLVRLIRHARSYGQSAAIRSGVKIASGRWIATLDGDGQNDPADIPALWRIAQERWRGRRRRAADDRRASRAATGQLVEAASLGDRQRGAAPAAARRHAGYRLRAEAVSALAVPRSALFRSHASLSAGARAARGRRRALGAGQSSPAPARRLEIRCA